MGEDRIEKNLELERLVFFSDAVVAIAITLLVLDLRINNPDHQPLTFIAMLASWRKFLAFFLSFLIIAVFWKIHHQFFFYIRRIDNRVLFFNLGWLLFIVLIPFATTLISQDFRNKPAIFTYAGIILGVSIFQNLIWDYVAKKEDYGKEHLTEEIKRENRIACNIAMGNGILAMALAFISPILAFVTLFTRIITFRLSAVRYIESQAKRADKALFGKKAEKK